MASSNETANQMQQLITGLLPVV